MIILKNPVTTQSIITSFEVIRIIDDPINRLVQVEFSTNVSSGTMGVWSGDEYDAIGQYTDTDIKNRVEQIINENK